MVHAGPVPKGVLELMGIHAEAYAHEVLIAQPDGLRGAIRLISIVGPVTPPMRDGAQAWDSGGIFDINIRALQGIEPLHAAMGRAGFRAHAPVTDWDFGALAVREVVESDADGLSIALMERVHPPLAGYDGIGGNGWASLRFPVSDLADFAQKMRAGGCSLSDPQKFVWAPFGMAKAICATTPWGARIEALQLV